MFALFFAEAAWIEDTSVGEIKPWKDIAMSSNGVNLAAVAWDPFEFGQIYTSDDLGATWKDVTPAGVESEFNKKFFERITSSADGAKLAAVTNFGYIWRSEDYGATWIEVTSSFGDTLRYWGDITSSEDGQKLAAAEFGGNIWISSDSGELWTELTSLPPFVPWRAITSSSDGTKLAAAGIGTSILVSLDSGSTWTAWSPTDGTSKWWTSITSSADFSILAAVGTMPNIQPNPGQIYTSDGLGVTWTEVTPTDPSPSTFSSITSSADGNKLVAVVEGGKI